jgi:hypothetical protein
VIVSAWMGELQSERLDRVLGGEIEDPLPEPAAKIRHTGT